MSKKSLYDRVVELGFAPGEARALILAGRVLVNGAVEARAGIMVPASSRIEVEAARKYASRAAHKLAGALGALAVPVAGRVAIDLGASHGGFTQVLLEAGARRVYAVDVAYGILDYSLRTDARVIALEKKNARELSIEWFLPADLTDAAGLLFTCDLAFISLKTILSALVRFRAAARAKLASDESPPRWEGLFLVKPQFEASEKTVGGVIRDAALREAIIDDVADFAASQGFRLLGRVASETPGARGNREAFLRLEFP